MELLSAADREAMANQTDNFGVTPLFLARQKWVHPGDRVPGEGTGHRCSMGHAAIPDAAQVNSPRDRGRGTGMGPCCSTGTFPSVAHVAHGDRGDRGSGGRTGHVCCLDRGQARQSGQTVARLSFFLGFWERGRGWGKLKSQSWGMLLLGRHTAHPCTPLYVGGE